MFANLTYKQKLLGLLVVTILLLFTANKRSFKITKQAYEQVIDLEEKMKYVNSSTQGIGQMQNELRFYDKIIGKQGIKAEEIQQGILSFIIEQQNVNVVNLEEIHIAESNGFNIITNQLIIEGSFNHLLETIYFFEKEFKFSNIISVVFNKEKEHQTKKEKLRVKIIFQNYEKSK